MADLIPVKVKGNVGTIVDNLDLVEASIRDKVAEYSAIVITEDSIKDGKKLLADIRKEKNSLDGERKAIKAQWMAPYNEFEKRAKRIIALYDEPVRLVNGQLAEFEEARKERKRQDIARIYAEAKGDMGDWLPLEKIYDAKWENATCTERKIREDMDLAFGQMEISISTVKSMGSEFEGDALRVLKETGSLQAAIAEINSLQKQKERFLEQARREAEQERQEAERKKREAEQSRAEVRQEPTEAAQECAVEAEDAPILPGPSQADTAAVQEAEAFPFAEERVLTVTVKVGENDFGMLKEFLDSVGIEWEVTA